MKFKSFLWSVVTLLALSAGFTACSDDDDPVTPPTPDTPSGLTFTLNVSNISAHAADLEVIPSDDQSTYFADLIPAMEIAGMDEQAKIDYIVARMKPSDVVKGRQFVPASVIEQDLPLDPETDYVWFALGFDGQKVTSKLATKTFTTLKESEQPEGEAPEVSLEGAYLPASNEIAFTVKCLSEDATAGQYAVAEKDMIDTMIGELSIEGVLNEGNPFEAEWITALNAPEGLRLALGAQQGVAKGQVWTMLVRVDNGKGKTIKRADCAAEGEAPEPGAIDVQTEGYAGDEQGQNGDKYICIYMTCPTKDATEAYYAFGATTVVDKKVSEAGSLEAFMDAYQQSLVDMVPSALNELNADTPMLLKFGPDSGIQPNTSYTWVIRVKNAAGKQALKSVAIKTERASTLGAPDVEFVGLEQEGKLVFGARCTSQDAVYGGLIAFAKSDYDSMISDGMTMQSILEAFPESVNVFSEQWLGYLNSTDGISLAVGDAQPGLVLAALLEVRNQTGKTFRYADTEGGQDGEQIGGGETPDPQPEPAEGLELAISGTYDRMEDALFIDMICRTADAAEAYVVILTTKDLNAMMAANKMTEQEVVGMAIQQNMAVAFDTDMLSMLNGEGLGLTMTEAQNLVRDEKYSFLLMGTNADMASRTVRLDIVYGEDGVNTKELLELTQAEFKQYIWDYTQDVHYKFAGDKPTVLEFGATWCGGCQQTLPVLEKLAKEYDGRVNFFQSDVDNDPQSYQLMGGMVEGSGIPLVMFLDMNSGYKAIRGALPSPDKIEAEFRKQIEAILAVKPDQNPDPQVDFGFTLSAKCFVDGGLLKAHITMQSPSKDVDKAYYMWAQKPTFDKNLGYFKSIEQMFDEVWVDPLSAEAVAAMNGEGYVYEAVEDGAFFLPEMMFTFALDARNAAGQRMVKRVDFMAVKDTEVIDPDLPVGPQVDGDLVVDGWAGDRQKARPFDHCTFLFKYPGAKSGRYFLSDAASLDAFEQDGFDVIEAKGYDFEAARMERMRSEEGLYIDLEFLPEATAAIAYRITNAKGEVKEGRYDVKLASLVEGNGPSVVVEMGAGDQNGENSDTAINAGMVCMTKDAVGGRYNLYDSKSLDAILEGSPNYPLWKLAMNGGQRIEDVPDYNIWNLKWFNESGFGYVQTGLQPNTSYAMLVIAYNIDGVYTVERADCSTAAGGKAVAQALRNRYTHAYAANPNAVDLREIRKAEPQKQMFKGQLVPSKFDRKPARKQALVAEGRTMTERPMMITGKLFGAVAPKTVARDVKAFEVASVAEMNSMRTAQGVVSHNAQTQMISKAQTRYEAVVMGQKSAKRLALGKFLK